MGTWPTLLNMAQSGYTHIRTFYIGKKQWSRLPDNPNKEVGVTVISSLLTSVGGYNSHDVVDTNTVLNLSRKWSEVCHNKFGPPR